MASVIREGGKTPLKVAGWLDAIKSIMLDEMNDRFGSCDVRLLENHVFSDRQYEWIKSRFCHEVKMDDAHLTIQEMYRDGWIEAIGYTCECCKGKEHPWQEILKHVTVFRLTAKGRELIPEHIMP